MKFSRSKLQALCCGAALTVLLLFSTILTGCRSGKPPSPRPVPVVEATRSAAQASRLFTAGNWSGAAREWENAANEFFLLNDLTNAAVALHNLAQAQLELRQHTAAITNLEHAAELNQRVDRREEWFRNQIALLQVEAVANRTEALSTRIEKLRSQIERIRDRSLRGMFLNELALFQKTRGELNDALETLQRASAEFSAAEDRLGTATVFANQAQVFEQQMNYPAALDAWQAALREFEALASPPGIARSLTGMGRTLLAARQNLPRAEELLRQAARNYRTLRHDEGRRVATELLAETLEAQNKAEAAAAIRKDINR